MSKIRVIPWIFTPDNPESEKKDIADNGWSVVESNFTDNSDCSKEQKGQKD